MPSPIGPVPHAPGRSLRCCAAALCLWSPALAAQTIQDARAALNQGDTAFAIQTLRAVVTDKSSPEQQCLLATVIARSTTSAHEDWTARDEARRWFERSLKARQDPVCLLELASLFEKQGIRVDAGRLARRAFELLIRDSTTRTPEALAEAYYRRALPLADWVRNFEDLVLVNDLPVSTGNCDEQVLFCEAVLHPADFLARLERASPAEDLVEREREVLRALLDSALMLVPDHAGALHTALREAATRGNWERYLLLAVAARRADSGATGSLLAVLSGLVTLGRYDAAAVVFDTLMERLGPDAMARYEGLALVADPSLRERLAGARRVVYGEAIWGLSDPLYLTTRNERRLAHYARIVLADVLFSDPAAGRAGRETPQGRLVIRYGLPRRRFAVRADERLKLTEWQREMMDQVLACGTKPTFYLGPRRTEGEDICVPALAGGQSFDAGGRWEFWYYDDDGPPLIFERALGYRVARHMFETRSRELDSLLHRTTPSTFAPPYTTGAATLLLTAFPRPAGAVVEAWARFTPPESLSVAGGPEVGLFIHDAQAGRELGRYVAARPTRIAVVGRALRVPWGRLRITAEAAWAGRMAAAQTSGTTTPVRPEGPAVWLSELLLGDSATAPPVLASREQLQMRALTDSVLPAPGSLAVYWENYGLTATPDGVHYRVRLSLQDAEHRPVAARVLRSVGRALGLGRDVGQTVEWEVRREAAAEVLPDLVVLALPAYRGDLRITVEVQDLNSRRSATTRRVVTLGTPDA